MNIKKKNILIDCDEVIVFSGYLGAVNTFLNTNYKIDDFTDYYIDYAAIPKERQEEFNQFLNGYNLYENAELLPGAYETLQKLSKYYNIYILSAWANEEDSIDSIKLLKNKYDLLRKELPFISPKNFIFTSAKQLFSADVQIDDLLSNLTCTKNINLKILFPSYHNKDIPKKELDKLGIVRAGFDWKSGWKEIEKLLINEK